MDEPPATTPKAPPRPWRWKLWHLMALVAVTAAAMTLDHYSPGTLYGWAILVVIFAPMFLATVNWDWLLNRFLRLVRVPRRSLWVLAIKALIVVIFLAAYRLWIALVIPWLKVWLPE